MAMAKVTKTMKNMTKTKPLPRNKDELRPVDRAFIHSVMFQLGILPIEDPLLDMRRPLKDISPEEARVLKRKFRKLWRKAARAQVGTGKTAKTKKEMVNRKFGVGKTTPSRAERNERKRLVLKTLWDEQIGPMLQKFENPDHDRDLALESSLTSVDTNVKK